MSTIWTRGAATPEGRNGNRPDKAAFEYIELLTYSS